MTDKLAIELLREWDFHNQPHHCYYEESNDSGIEECPSREFGTLRAFLKSRDYPVDTQIGLFFGRSFSEPSFRSGISGHGISGQDKQLSIAEMRRAGALRRNRGVHYRETTDEVLSTRAQRAAKAPSENDERPWEVEAMEYFKERLDEIHESMVRAFSGVMAGQSRHETLLSDLLTSVNALEEKVAERSEAAVGVQPVLNITLTGVPADIAETLQDELQKRVERLSAQRERR